MTKKLIYCFIFLFYIATNSQIREGLVIHKNPKIGLSLSGGGAKGFAHVGVLKVLDSLGIKIDYIGGTSMGAIVGGLYASGYSGKEIEKMIKNIDFFSVLANEKNRKEATFFNKSTDKYILTFPVKKGKINILPKAYSKGQKNIYLLKELFKNVSNIDDFSKLPIPFFCVATNLENGKEKIFENGDLANSIMASSAFPGLIDPIKIGDSLYIDGAISLNYPSQPLKEKGMDIVIGVDLNQGLTDAKNLNSAIDILNQVIDINIQKETKNQYQYTDINIKPNLKGLSSISYDEKDKIVALGYEATNEYNELLKELPKRHTNFRFSYTNIYSNVYKIDSLVLENKNIFNQSYVKGKLGLKIPSLQTYGSINKMIERLYATNNYDYISYDINNINNKKVLKIDVVENDTKFYLKFGLHYDEIFHTGLLINATLKRLIFNNSTITLDAIIGDKPRYYFNYFIDNGYIPGLGVYSSGMSFDLKNKNGDEFENWQWFRNEVYLQSIWKDKFAIGGGISLDNYRARDVYNNTILTKSYFNPYFFLKTDTQDDPDFPTNGMFLHAEGKVLDILNTSLEKKSLQAKANISLNIPLDNFLTIRLKCFGGFSIGDYKPYFYQYRFGGLFEQNLGNFTSFSGNYFGEEQTNNFLSTSFIMQGNWNKKFFVTTNYEIGNSFDIIGWNEVFKITQQAIGIGLGYKSPFGQIKLNYSTDINFNKKIFNVILGHWF